MADSLCSCTDCAHHLQSSGFKRMIAIGSVLSVILLVASACAVSSLPALFLLQGIFLGIAHAMSLPLVSLISPTSVTGRVKADNNSYSS